MGNEKNDKKILEMKSQIAIKKDELSKRKGRFIPATNCSLEMDGVRVNIQTLTKEQLQMLFIKLNMYLKSAEEFKMENCCNFSGYNVIDWMQDVQSKLKVMSFKDEENKLKIMESKLEALLSSEKKTELELDEIASMLI
ncbi:MAG: hypothetical protein RSF81_08510 [Oscillospiraceae bacterium]